MTGFRIISQDHVVIRFGCYTEDAPVTSEAFMSLLPFKCNFFHARVSGEEIWTDGGPGLDIIQENASVFTDPGEVVIGPVKPVRVRTAGLMGIYYGEGKGLDAANIFARVFDEDLPALKILGDKIWKEGKQELLFEKL